MIRVHWATKLGLNMKFKPRCCKPQYCKPQCCKRVNSIEDSLGLNQLSNFPQKVDDLKDEHWYIFLVNFVGFSSNLFVMVKLSLVFQPIYITKLVIE